MEENREDYKLFIGKKKLVIIGRSSEDPEEEDEKILLNSLKSYLDKNTFVWEAPNVKEFKFNLPKTEFIEEKKMNFEIFQESDIIYDESYSSDKLTDEQLKEILEKGQFSVKSRQKDVPYVWQLSTRLHKGKEHVKASFYYDISLSLQFFYTLKNRFHFCKEEHRNFNIAGSFKFFFSGVKDLFALFQGRPRFTNNYMDRLRYSGRYLNAEAVKQYQKNLLAEFPEINTSIYYPNTQRIIKKIESDVQKLWNKEKILIEHDLKLRNLTSRELKEQLFEIRIERLINAYENTSKLNNKNKSAIIDLIKSEQIFQKIQFDFREKLQSSENSLKERIKKDNPIRRHIKEWYKYRYEKLIQAEKKLLEEEKLSAIEKELEQYPTHKAMIKSFIAFNNNIQENYKTILRKEKKDSFYTFTISINKMQPYEVVSSIYKNYNNVEITEYNFKYTDSIQLKASYPNWRITLMFKRIYASVINIMLFCYNNCWNDSFGLKAFCASEIIKHYSLHRQTGEVSPSNKSFTYISSLKNFCGSISKSRADFINSSDKGFLGSKLGNVMNWVENYIFRLFFSLIIIGILYPISIILYTLLFFALTLIALAGAIIYFILLTFFINIFIFDTDETDYRKFPCLPFLWIVMKRFIGQFMFNLIITFILILYQIIAGICMIIFGCLRWTFRSIYDSFTYILIKCNAKIPKANTSFAWRIAGPGISRTLFYKLEIEDALLLVKAELEKIELDNYQKNMHKSLNEPVTRLENLNKKVLNNFNSCIETPPQIYASIQPYLNIINDQIAQRRRIYPNLIFQVRFIKSDLDVVLEATYDMVREFFKNENMNYIWEHYQLVPLSWRSLTEKVLIQTFKSEDVLMDVDDSELKSDQNKKHLNKDNEDLYNKLSLGEFKKRADKKLKKLELLSGSKSSDYIEEEYYHGRNYALPRFNQREFDNAGYAAQFETDSIYQGGHHFNIVNSEDCYSDVERFKLEFADDESIAKNDI